jgi:exopolysaccharide biosynthesis WecB/TagA/CpsF family protein
MPAPVSSPQPTDVVRQFAGLKFTPMDTAAAVEVLARRDPREPFAVYTTPNVEHIYWSKVDADFNRCNASAFLSTNDSRVLHRLALMARLELAFAPGAYVVAELFARVIQPDDPLAIIGCSPSVVADLTSRFGLRSVSHHNPPMGFIHDPAAVAEAAAFVAAHPARFVFIAMGPPQSELFCRHVAHGGAATGLALCIGSSLATLIGRADPAPKALETAGLVWLYRLFKEPKRLWRRYLIRDLAGLWLALCDIVRIRFFNSARS